MRKKTLFVSVLLVFFITSFISALVAIEYLGQEKEETVLAPKYKAFLAETERFMHSREKEVFLKLKNDHDRDLFIKQFWNSRGGRQRGVRTNINMLRLAVMVQALDLTEDQAAAIMPAMNKNEEEKRQLQQANYIIFLQEFYRGLQQQLDNARRNQQRSQQLRRKKR